MNRRNYYIILSVKYNEREDSSHKCDLSIPPTKETS